jgi:hypothetical protein
LTTVHDSLVLVPEDMTVCWAFPHLGTWVELTSLSDVHIFEEGGQLRSEDHTFPPLQAA